MISCVSVSVSEPRSPIDWLTTNASDVLFAFPDAPTVTPTSPIVSTPGADSNKSKLVSNRPSGPYISPSTFRNLLRLLRVTVGAEGQKGRRMGEEKALRTVRSKGGKKVKINKLKCISDMQR
jgi:hypothetical protein